MNHGVTISHHRINGIHMGVSNPWGPNFLYIIFGFPMKTIQHLHDYETPRKNWASTTRALTSADGSVKWDGIHLQRCFADLLEEGQRHLPLFAWPWWLKTYDHWERLPSIFPAVLIIGKITKNQSVQLCWFLWDNWAFDCFWPVYENWKENGDFLSQIRDNLRIVTNKWQPRDFSKLWFSHNLARSSKLSGQEG